MRLIKIAKEKNIKIILTSPEFSQKSAKFIAKKINGKVVSFSPLQYNIFDNILRVAKLLNEYRNRIIKFCSITVFYQVLFNII
jgi:zinc transport system substrate-binding protein